MCDKMSLKTFQRHKTNCGHALILRKGRILKLTDFNLYANDSFLLRATASITDISQKVTRKPPLKKNDTPDCDVMEYDFRFTRTSVCGIFDGTLMESMKSKPMRYAVNNSLS